MVLIQIYFEVLMGIFAVCALINKQLYSETPPYGHLVITATLFWPRQKISQIFSYLMNPLNITTPLIQPDFYGPLATGLAAGFHCTLNNFTLLFSLLVILINNY